MKYILVPTDFSDCASWASDFAVHLAEKTSNGVLFFTRLFIHPLWHELSESARKDYPESKNKILKAESKFNELKEKYRLSNVPIRTSFHSGDLVDNVLRIIDEYHIEFVVMGSTGADGLKEILFGSNAQKLVKHTPRPIFVIKHPVDGKQLELKNIVFASDFQAPAKKPFEELVEFATAFGSHIHLLHVDMTAPDQAKNDAYMNKMQEFEKLCWKLPTTIHEMGDLGLEKGITHFAHDTHADMVAVAKFKKTPIQRLIHGSITEDLVNHLEIPVLVINDPDMYEEDEYA